MYYTNACATIFSPAQTFASRAVQEIRQLHMKQEGFVREISDLQETLEWKDKKIGVRLLSPRGGGFLSQFHFSCAWHWLLLFILCTSEITAHLLSCCAARGSAQALERQKEYTDAIRTERDELREEVVKLKDTLKVLGQDTVL